MHLFDHDTKLMANEQMAFDIIISDNWSINKIPNGGFLLGILANAALAVSEKQSTPIVTANFLSRTIPGPAAIKLKKISSSKQFERFEVSLFQDHQETIRAMATFSDQTDECTVTRYETNAPRMDPVDHCIAIPEIPGYSVFSNMDIRMDPECVGWMSGKLTQRSEHKGWIRFQENRGFDVAAILLVADAFPPPVFASQGMVAWVPTLEFSVSIRNMPVSKWLKCVFRTRFITCGLLEEDGQVWDEGGNLVAISRQVAQYKVTPQQ